REKNRILNLNDINNSNYIDFEKVQFEIREAKKFFQNKNWPIIDVTRKSVEETVANIIKLYDQRKLKV
ncbi:MAG: kinase/pyrophosphorylase, partial [Pseudomonadota bacterium]